MAYDSSVPVDPTIAWDTALALLAVTRYVEFDEKPDADQADALRTVADYLSSGRCAHSRLKSATSEEERFSMIGSDVPGEDVCAAMILHSKILGAGASPVETEGYGRVLLDLADGETPPVEDASGTGIFMTELLEVMNMQPDGQQPARQYFI